MNQSISIQYFNIEELFPDARILVLGPVPLRGRAHAGQDHHPGATEKHEGYHPTLRLVYFNLSIYRTT